MSWDPFLPGVLEVENTYHKLDCNFGRVITLKGSLHFHKVFGVNF